MPAIEPKTEDQDNCVVVFHPSTPCRAALECAGCLDIARLKQFLALEAALDEKQSLSEVVKMLVGLRKSWSDSSELREESGEYGGQEAWLFAHEHLAACQISLQFVVWLHAAGRGRAVSRMFRQIDRAATSVVLNIAKGNGRPLEADHRQFLATAESSVVKAADAKTGRVRPRDRRSSQCSSAG